MAFSVEAPSRQARVPHTEPPGSESCLYPSDFYFFFIPEVASVSWGTVDAPVLAPWVTRLFDGVSGLRCQVELMVGAWSDTRVSRREIDVPRRLAGTLLSKASPDLKAISKSTGAVLRTDSHKHKVSVRGSPEAVGRRASRLPTRSTRWLAARCALRARHVRSLASS